MAEYRIGSCLSDLFIFGCLGLLIILGCGGGAFLLWAAKARAEKPVIEESAPVMIDLGRPVPPAPTPEIAPAEPLRVDEPASASSPSQKIEVEFPAAADRNFELDVESSTLSRFPTSFSYELKARLIVGPVIAKKIVAQLELFDSEGARAGALAVEILPGSHEVLPGDSIPIHSLIYQEKPAPESASAKLTFVETEFWPHPASAVNRGELVESFQTPFAPPAGILVEFRQRDRKISPDFLSPDDTNLRLALEIENASVRDIVALKLAVEPYSADGEKLPVSYGIIETNWPPNVSPVAFPQYPRWKPGERRVKAISLRLPGVEPGEVAGYRVGVFEVE